MWRIEHGFMVFIGESLFQVAFFLAQNFSSKKKVRDANENEMIKAKGQITT